jgi:hypothetical protein
MTAAVSLANLAKNGGVGFPSWTTGTRPSNPYAGQAGFNTTLGYPEYYDGATWWQFNIAKSYTASYLVVSGGGGGGSAHGGGGGAGGLLTGSSTLAAGTNYTVTVGAGGAGGASGAGNRGSNGSNSSFALSLIHI